MSNVPANEQAAKAVAHPLRARILEALAGDPRSPNGLAVEFEEPVGNVSYHVVVLRDLGMIELVDTAHRRGAVEHSTAPGGASNSMSDR